jgi:hypothetical protein
MIQFPSIWCNRVWNKNRNLKYFENQKSCGVILWLGSRTKSTEAVLLTYKIKSKHTHFCKKISALLLKNSELMMRLKPSGIDSSPLWTDQFLTDHKFKYFDLPRNSKPKNHSNRNTCLHILRYFVVTMCSFLINLLSCFVYVTQKVLLLMAIFVKKLTERIVLCFNYRKINKHKYQLPLLLFTGKIGENCDHLVSRYKKLAWIYPITNAQSRSWR